MQAKIRAYQSCTDIETSLRYVEGHKKVLESYGVTKVTSANYNWVYDTNTYVIIVTSLDNEKIYGGCRVQIRGAQLPMPMEDAIAKVDPNIYQFMDKYGDVVAAEFCGLFNSKEVAGYGIGSMYLGRVGVAIASQIGVQYLLGLCSPATYRNCARVGFETIRELGENGRFYYPKEGLIATSVIIKDLVHLPLANFEEKEEILYLRSHPVQTKTENGPKGEMEIIYDTLIKQ